MSSRDNVVQARLNDRENEYLEKLADEFGVSKSEAIRIVLYDSRFLYSDGVSFGDVNVEPQDLVRDEDSTTTGREAVKRIFNP
ncbi:MAG: copG family ribbon-helix-helix protein [Candidatus Nanosalina sp. J07AB43]|jgi:Ribbon-helix-helix protein, copG family.|nr:MAG: copG family ribbon-helix-helix protein [Candidatus Nanosalina sp. J07AB43]